MLETVNNSVALYGALVLVSAAVLVFAPNFPFFFAAAFALLLFYPSLASSPGSLLEHEVRV